VYCTPGRSKKVVVALVVVAVVSTTTKQVITGNVYRFTDSNIVPNALNIVKTIVFYVVLPVTVLAINMTVVCGLCAVRRASNNTAANLGQQSTSSSSAVPTVMLVSTSLVYVLLCGMSAVVSVVRLLVLRIRHDKITKHN